MNLTINTAKLQEMVSKVIRGAGNNKLLPITCMLGIDLSDNVFTLETTDGVNYLFISDDVSGDDFEVTVYADTFAKLISRMTCENVSMTLTDKFLEINGNGTYKVDLPFDENGQIVKFPNPTLNKNFVSVKDSLYTSTVNMILNSVKPALAVTTEAPQYTAYWVGDMVVATDSFKIAGYEMSVFEEPRLISAQTMELLSITSSPEFSVLVNADDDTEILFNSNDCQVFTKLVSGIEDFSIDAIKGLLASEFVSSCEVSKVQLLQLLDRLSLFVRPFDDGNINMVFTNEGIVISSLANSGSELIPYSTINDFADFSCSVNINLLQSQVKSNINDLVKIYFGKPESIKIKDGKITKIVALNE